MAGDRGGGPWADGVRGRDQLVGWGQKHQNLVQSAKKEYIVVSLRYHFLFSAPILLFLAAIFAIAEIALI